MLLCESHVYYNSTAKTDISNSINMSWLQQFEGNIHFKRWNYVEHHVINLGYEKKWKIFILSCIIILILTSHKNFRSFCFDEELAWIYYILYSFVWYSSSCFTLYSRWLFRKTTAPQITITWKLLDYSMDLDYLIWTRLFVKIKACFF